jgi:hypothetical protein
MTPKVKAKELVNEKYYQPLTLHLNVNNNSKEMWEYAKRCALIMVDEILPNTWKLTTYKKSFGFIDVDQGLTTEYWEDVKKEIQQL